MMADLVRCTCSRLNDPWRRHCHGCGRHLEPACKCGFVNAKSDQYCGGCGTRMAQQASTSEPAQKSEPESTQPIDITDLIR